MRHLEAESLGCSHVDDEVEFGRLLDRDVAGLGAAHDLTRKKLSILPGYWGNAVRVALLGLWFGRLLGSIADVLLMYFCC